MNWFRKTIKLASVTFFIEGSENIAQPMTLLDISFDIVKFILYEKKLKGLKLTYDSISPDTSSNDYYATTGIINFYLTDPRLNKDFVTSLVEDYNKYKPNIRVSVGPEEQSGIYKHKVIRLHIFENNTTEIEEIPSFNVSNDNARAILTLLKNNGLNIDPNSYAGVIDVDNLKQALQQIQSEDFQIPAHTQPSTTISEPGNSIITDMGRSQEQINRYLSNFAEIIKWIDKNDLPSRKINYA